MSSVLFWQTGTYMHYISESPTVYWFFGEWEKLKKEKKSIVKSP
jgi:hypothetical protein